MDLLTIICCVTNILLAIAAIEYINISKEKIHTDVVTEVKKETEVCQYEPYLVLKITMPDDVWISMVESIDVLLKDNIARTITWMYTKDINYIGNDTFIAEIGCLYYKDSPIDADKLTKNELLNIREIQKFNYSSEYKDKGEIHCIEFYVREEKVENAN